MPAPLPAVVYRAIKNKWHQDGRVLRLAYFRKKDSDGNWEPGPSVGSSKQAAVAGLSKIKYVGRLSVSDIHAVINPLNQTALRLEMDTDAHGQIMGIPIHEESPEAARAVESIAGELARQSDLEELID